MDDLIINWRTQVLSGMMTVINYIWNCGIHYGYKPCCIKNYINLHKLQLHPALFMSVVLGHNAKSTHVLCPMCHDTWAGERREPQYDLTRDDVLDSIREYKSMKDNLTMEESNGC